MIIYETISDTLTRAYSDAGVYIERDGIEYVDAVDPTSIGRTYTETTTPIPTPDDPEVDSDDYKAALTALGLLSGDGEEAGAV